MAALSRAPKSVSRTKPPAQRVEGSSDVPNLPPGAHTVTVEATGLKRSINKEVPVKIGSHPVALVLERGNMAETVTLTAGTDEIT
jgi:hypothetical protein